MPRTGMIILAVALLVTACSSPEGSEPTKAPTASPAQETHEYRNPQTCVEGFDPTFDYFPEKATPRYAERFSVEYFSHYKVVTITLLDGVTTYRYLLLQCGTPLPEAHGDAQVIEVPVSTVVTTSTADLPHLVELDVVDRLAGHDELDYVSSREIRARIEAGEVVEVGHESRLNLEVLLDVNPDVLFTTGLGGFDKDMSDLFAGTGIRVVRNPSFLESRPLGSAEWIVFTSLFFNREDRAAEVFAEIAKGYAEVAARARGVTERPSVFAGAPLGDVWYVPGGKSFVAQLVADAGGRYLWADLPKAGTVPLAVESVYELALGADFWLQPGIWSTLEDIAAADERLIALSAVTEGRVYANDKRMNGLGEQGVGGNDYWESGALRPDLVLADLLKVLHPELVPEHELYFHRRIEAP